jgi:drug/metabolite transporter (DMT)-like permease
MLSPHALRTLPPFGFAFFRYNYPNFLNLFSTFMYIPICFAYIVPVARYGWLNGAISPDQLALSKFPFIIMGALDCLAGMMQIFATVYLPGPLLVLLTQATIPCSMILSRHITGERYSVQQYAGASVVVLGIAIVLFPVLTHARAPDFYCEAVDPIANDDCTVCQEKATQDSCLFSNGGINYTTASDSNSSDLICHWIPYSEAAKEEEALTFMWSLVMLASVIPMTLSTIYKEMALGGALEIDPVYLNGWIAIFQFLFSLLLAVPAGWMASPSVTPEKLPENIWDGWLCFGGLGTFLFVDNM